MNQYHNCINYLLSKKTNLIPHGDKTFFDHMVGVYNFLRKINQPNDVCFAGLFHSIYGNEFFDAELNPSREEIKNIIGPEAESLVFKFNNTSREELWNSDNVKIKNILLANKLDIDPLFNIYNYVFDEKNIDTLYGVFRDVKPWRFTGAGSNINSRKFNYELNKKDKTDKILFNAATNILKKENLFDFVKLKRAYASGYLYGTIHDFHTDDTANDYNEIFTVMFYLNKIWALEYAGETVFLNKQRNDIQYSISPGPGKAVIFDGFISHAAREISRSCMELRMVATFKYGLKNV